MKAIPIVSALLSLMILAAWGAWLNQNRFWAGVNFMRFQLEQDEALRCGCLLKASNLTPEANLNLDSLIQQTYPDGRFELDRSVVLQLPGEYAIAELKQRFEWWKPDKKYDGSQAHWLLLKKKPSGEYGIIHTCRKSFA